jgi:hypothetical protein
VFHCLPVDPLVCDAFDLRKRFLQAAPFHSFPLVSNFFVAASRVHASDTRACCLLNDLMQFKGTKGRHCVPLANLKSPASKRFERWWALSPGLPRQLVSLFSGHNDRIRHLRRKTRHSTSGPISASYLETIHVSYWRISVMTASGPKRTKINEQTPPAQTRG